MCGICGSIGLSDQSLQDKIVRSMNLLLRHRGPDETGFYSDEFCSLAMSRLSIIDITGGQQPIFSEDGKSCIFHNGEIYNYQELRAILIEKGHCFKTKSDTEVILHLYEDYGIDSPKFLKGMFAFCIYEIAEKKFFFARDRFGEKPLYYFQNNNGLAFSSEIKSLLENTAISRKLNVDFLHYYLKAEYVPEPWTLLKNVFSLPPGHSMIYQDGKVQLSKYYNFDYAPDTVFKSENDIIEYLEPILDRAIKRQTMSEVPIGAFLSGGIDSSTVVAKLQQNSSEKIKTFNVRFEEATYDESPIAREVAKFLGTDHHEIVVPNTDFSEDIFWTIVEHVGLPFPDSSAIPTYLISKEIKKHITVALSSDGGDELFAGYKLFDWYLKINRIRSTPVMTRALLIHFLAALKKRFPFNNSSLVRQLSRALKVSLLDETKIPMAIHDMFEDKNLEKLLQSNYDFKNSNTHLLEDYPPEFYSWTPLRKIMYFRIKYNLPLDMLIKVDRMSMATSLEVRAPLLDVDLFEASTKIPDKYLFKNGQGKYLIRKLMKDQLPDCVFNHPKSGFSIPLHKYQNAKFRGLTEDLFSTKTDLLQLFSKDYLEKVKYVGLNNYYDNSEYSVYKSSHQLWSLMQLFGWFKRFNVQL